MESSEPPFYLDGLNFSCKRCSCCCGHAPGFVYLSQADLDLLCGFFNMTAADFVDTYCRWVNYYGGIEVLALKEKQNYDCWLWENGCSAYEARPVQCRTYPFWTWMLKDRNIWNECAETCPGMNSGRTWTFEEIEEQRHRYHLNRPVERNEFYKK